MGHSVSSISEKDGHAIVHMERVGRFGAEDGDGSIHLTLEICEKPSVKSVTIVSGPWDRDINMDIVASRKAMKDLVEHPKFKAGAGIYAYGVGGFGQFLGNIVLQMFKMGHLFHICSGYDNALAEAQKGIAESKIPKG